MKDDSITMKLDVQPGPVLGAILAAIHDYEVTNAEAEEPLDTEDKEAASPAQEPEPQAWRDNDHPALEMAREKLREAMGMHSTQTADARRLAESIRLWRIRIDEWAMAVDALERALLPRRRTEE